MLAIIQKNVLIFKKLVEKYFKKYIKNTINILYITKYVLKKCLKPKPKPSLLGVARFLIRCLFIFINYSYSRLF